MTSAGTLQPSDDTRPLWQRMGLPAPDVPSPGPWTGDDAGNVRDAEGRLVAQLMRKADMGRVVAVNELLDALEQAIEALRCGDPNAQLNALRDCPAVVAKAKRSQP